MKDTIQGLHIIDDLPGDCRVEIQLSLEVSYIPREGDGWNSPWVPAHWEPEDGVRVEAVILYHYDGDWTEVQIGKGSILEYYFLCLLPLGIEDILFNNQPVDCYQQVGIRACGYDRLD